MHPVAQPIEAKLTPRPFRLWQLFVVIAATSLILALGTQFGPIGAALAIVLGVVFASLLGAWWLRRRWIAFVPPSLLLLAFCIVPVVPVARVNRRHATCLNSLKNITLALHLYHDEHGSFPPAFVTDADGTPLYSWRVLILPYLEETGRYSEFRLDEPWDSPHNLALAEHMPSLFRCPKHGNRLTMTTTYVAISGDETMWPGEASLTLNDFKDGTANTLAIIEWPESDIIWTEPRDLPLDRIDRWWHVPAKIRRGDHRHADGKVSVAFADGHVRQVVPHALSAKELRSLFTPAGNDSIPIGQFK